MHELQVMCKNCANIALPLCAAVLLVSASAVAAQDAQYSLPLIVGAREPTNTLGPIIRVAIAGQKLNIPRNYFWGHLPSDRSNQSILIHGFIPSLEPLTSATEAEFHRTKGFGRTISVLLMDAKTVPPLYHSFAAVKERAQPFLPEIEKFGLRVLLPEIRNKAGAAHKEILFSMHEGRLDSYLRCDIDGTVPDPGCNQEFVDEDVLVGCTYDKYFLPIWADIQNSVRQLLRHFKEEI